MTSLDHYSSNHFEPAAPPGAVAGDWRDLTEFLEDVHRCLTWSRHDAAGISVAVEGVQHVDGRVERFVVIRPDTLDPELAAMEARQLAAALLDAADVLDAVR